MVRFHFQNEAVRVAGRDKVLCFNVFSVVFMLSKIKQKETLVPRSRVIYTVINNSVTVHFTVSCNKVKVTETAGKMNDNECFILKAQTQFYGYISGLRWQKDGVCVRIRGGWL